jgi:hypothetical protein
MATLVEDVMTRDVISVRKAAQYKDSSASPWRSACCGQSGVWTALSPCGKSSAIHDGRGEASRCPRLCSNTWTRPSACG